MRIGLVFPGISGSGFSVSAEPRIRSCEASWINHGIASISSVLKRDGHTVQLFDLRRMSSWKEFRKKAKIFKPQVLGISVNSSDYRASLEVISIARKINRNVVIIVGGIHPTLAPGDFNTGVKVNYIFAGEAENSLPRLISEIETGISGDGQVIHGISAQLDSLPFADRELFDYHAELSNPVHASLPTPFVTLLAGRGCRHKCFFCQPVINAMHNNARRRSPAHLIEEMKFLHTRYRFKSFMFHDSDFFDDPDWVEEFYNQYSHTHMQKNFFVRSRSRSVIVNKDILRHFRDIGLSGVIIGLDSGSQRILNFLRTDTTLEENLEAASIVRESGLTLWANVIMGVPTETEEEMNMTNLMVREMAPDVLNPSFYMPMPGSYLGKYCRENGYCEEEACTYRWSTEGNILEGINYKHLNNILDQWEQELFKKDPLNGSYHLRQASRIDRNKQMGTDGFINDSYVEKSG